MPRLSVVIITKNQEWNVARLIESVIDNTVDLDTGEIVLVDSASQDRTVEIASTYPIRVLQLKPTQRLTAAAGRYVGFKNTTGDHVLFLDGDMELCPGWLEHGLAAMDANPQMATVTGTLIEMPPEAVNHRIEKPQVDKIDCKEVPHGGGAALYRRSVLEEIGTFNPYLYSDEEPELCIRIRHAGYKIYRLSYPISVHYSYDSEELLTLVKRWRRNLNLGSGQSIRYHYHMKTDVLWKYILERGHGIIPGIAILCGMVLLVLSIRTRHGAWFGVWLFSLLLVIGLDSLRKRSVHRAVHSMLKRLLILDGTIKGFFYEPRDPKDYPGEYEIIR